MSSPTMSLQDLEKHIPDQILKINRSIGYGNRFADFEEDEDEPSWATFRNSVWGNPSSLWFDSKQKVDTDTPSDGSGQVYAQQEVNMDVNVDVNSEGDDSPPSTAAPATLIELPGSLPNKWDLCSTHFLVRSEYEEAEQAALKTNEKKRNPFLVGGQSGIGKSVFVIWLLIRRLMLRLPTVLQIDTNAAIFFHEGGTSTFRDLENTDLYLGLDFENHRSRIWVLVDSNATLQRPTGVFVKGAPFFVVQVASRDNCFEWGKKLRPNYFYMKTWTLSELLQARPFMGLPDGPYDKSVVQLFYDTYRATPRELANFGSEPDMFERHITLQVKKLNYNAVRNALQSPESDESSNLITRIEPSAFRDMPTKTIGSPFAFRLLWDRHFKSQVSETAYFYDNFNAGGPGTASAAGWIFEYRMHQLLTEGYVLSLFPIRRTRSTSTNFDIYNTYIDTKNQTNLESHQLPPVKELALNEGMVIDNVDQYYRPQARNFAAIDSLFLFRSPTGSPILFMFQMTQNKDKHDVNEKGLDKLNGLTIPDGTRKYFVVVTPTDTEPKIQVPKGRFGDVVEVFHHRIQRDRLFPQAAKSS